MIDLFAAGAELVAGIVDRPPSVAELRRMGQRRRRRHQAAAGVVAALAALVATVAVIRGAGSSPPMKVTSTVPGTSPSTEVLTVTGGTAQTVDSTSGRVVRTVPLRPDLPQAPSGLVVSPDGTTAYASVYFGVACGASEIVRVDLASGTTRVEVSQASVPAISPDGATLAYVDLSGFTPGCGGAARITTKRLATGATRGWTIQDSTARISAAQVVTGLRWTADGARLLIGTGPAVAVGIQILDTGRPAGAGNPFTVPDTTRYSDPIPLSGNRALAVGHVCIDGASCPARPSGTTVDDVRVVDLTSGRSITTLIAPGAPGPSYLEGLVADPSGTRIDVVGSVTGGVTGLYTIADGRLRLVATVSGAVAWLPNPGHHGQPGTTG